MADVVEGEGWDGIQFEIKNRVIYQLGATARCLLVYKLSFSPQTSNIKPNKTT